MDVEVMRWFQQVADGETLTEVADLYMVSQPAVSRAFARLEEEVGTPLLEKKGRLLRPTRAGMVFKRHVDALVHEWDDGLAAVAQLAAPETGTVSVAFQLSLGTWLVPYFIEVFRRTYPGVRFELHVSDDLEGASLVASGVADLEFTSRRPATQEVEWQRMFSQRLGLLVPPGHPLNGTHAASLESVSREPFVMLRRGWVLRNQVDELCRRAGFEPTVGFEVDDLAVVAGFVRAGLGVSVIPTTRHREAIGESETVALTDAEAFRDVGLVWSTTRRMMPSTQLFKDSVLHPSRDSGSG